MPKSIFTPPFQNGVAYDTDLFGPPGDWLVSGQDIVMPNDVPRSRGELLVMTESFPADSPYSIIEEYFPIVDNTVTYLTYNKDSGGTKYTQWSRAIRTDLSFATAAQGGASTGNYPWTSTANLNYSPRCVYQGNVVYCSDNGNVPTTILAGASPSNTAVTGNTITTVANNSRINATAGSWSNGKDGWYFVSMLTRSDGFAPPTAQRITDTTSLYINLENIYNTNAVSTWEVQYSAFCGVLYPGVNVYNEGTVTTSGSNVNLTGGLWTGGVWGDVNADAWDSIMILDESANLWKQRGIGSKASSTQIGVGASLSISTGSQYQIMRVPCWIDAEVFAGSLWGIGQAQHPNRLYWVPPGHPLSIPPGKSLPFDMTDTTAGTASYDSPDPFEFEYGYQDIPGPFSGDIAKCLISSESVLLMISGQKCYGIYGDAAGINWQVLSEEAGIHNRESVFKGELGIYWAGKNGIFTLAGNDIVEISESGFRETWRKFYEDEINSTSLIKLFVQDYHLIVDAIGSVNRRVFIHDLRRGRWCGEFSNWAPTAYNVGTEKYPMMSGNLWTRTNDSAEMVSFLQVFRDNPDAHDEVSYVQAATYGPTPELETSWNLLADQKEMLEEIVIEDVEIAAVHSRTTTTNASVMTVTLQASEPLNYYSDSGSGIGGVVPTAADPHALLPEALNGVEYELSTVNAVVDPAGTTIMPVYYHWKQLGYRTRYLGIKIEISNAGSGGTHYMNEFQLHSVCVTFSKAGSNS